MRSARPRSRATDRTYSRAMLGAVGSAASDNQVCNGAGDVTVITLLIGAT
jgi:hypothetical protein